MYTVVQIKVALFGTAWLEKQQTQHLYIWSVYISDHEKLIGEKKKSKQSPQGEKMRYDRFKVRKM